MWFYYRIMSKLSYYKNGFITLIKVRSDIRIYYICKIAKLSLIITPSFESHIHYTDYTCDFTTKIHSNAKIIVKIEFTKLSTESQI